MSFFKKKFRKGGRGSTEEARPAMPPPTQNLEDPGQQQLVEPAAPIPSSTTTASPLPKAKKVSPSSKIQDRMNWLESSAFREGQQQQQQQTASTTSSSPRSTQKLSMKRAWLETAFTPTGGGNMPGVASPDSAEGGQSVASPNSAAAEAAKIIGASPRSEESYTFDNATTPPSRAKSGPKRTEVYYLDKSSDPYEKFYNVWYKAGLLAWRPETYRNDVEEREEEEEDGVDIVDNEDASGGLEDLQSTPTPEHSPRRPMEEVVPEEEQPPPTPKRLSPSELQDSDPDSVGHGSALEVPTIGDSEESEGENAVAGDLIDSLMEEENEYTEKDILRFHDPKDGAIVDSDDYEQDQSYFQEASTLQAETPVDLIESLMEDEQEYTENDIMRFHLSGDGEEDEAKSIDVLSLHNSERDDQDLKDEHDSKRDDKEASATVELLDKDQDPHRESYEVWHEKGLLEWKPAERKQPYAPPSVRENPSDLPTETGGPDIGASEFMDDYTDGETMRDISEFSVSTRQTNQSMISDLNDPRSMHSVKTIGDSERAVVSPPPNEDLFGVENTIVGSVPLTVRAATTTDGSMSPQDQVSKVVKREYSSVDVVKGPIGSSDVPSDAEELFEEKESPGKGNRGTIVATAAGATLAAGATAAVLASSKTDEEYVSNSIPIPDATRNGPGVVEGASAADRARQRLEERRKAIEEKRKALEERQAQRSLEESEPVPVVAALAPAPVPEPASDVRDHQADPSVAVAGSETPAQLPVDAIEERKSALLARRDKLIAERLESMREVDRMESETPSSESEELPESDEDEPTTESSEEGPRPNLMNIGVYLDKKVVSDEDPEDDSLFSQVEDNLLPGPLEEEHGNDESVHSTEAEASEHPDLTPSGLPVIDSEPDDGSLIKSCATCGLSEDFAPDMEECVCHEVYYCSAFCKKRDKEHSSKCPGKSLSTTDPIVTASAAAIAAQKEASRESTLETPKEGHEAESKTQNPYPSAVENAREKQRLARDYAQAMHSLSSSRSRNFRKSKRAVAISWFGSLNQEPEIFTYSLDKPLDNPDGATLVGDKKYGEFVSAYTSAVKDRKSPEAKQWRTDAYESLKSKGSLQ